MAERNDLLKYFNYIERGYVGREDSFGDNRSILHMIAEIQDKEKAYSIFKLIEHYYGRCAMKQRM